MVWPPLVYGSNLIRGCGRGETSQRVSPGVPDHGSSGASVVVEADHRSCQLIGAIRRDEESGVFIADDFGGAATMDSDDGDSGIHGFDEYTAEGCFTRGMHEAVDSRPHLRHIGLPPVESGSLSEPQTVD